MGRVPLFTLDLGQPRVRSGKAGAIDQHFGPRAVDRLILTRDKTMVKGDVLIDNKGIIAGARCRHGST